MPIYSYRCTKCGKIFEKFRKMGSEGKEYCDSCNSEALRLFLPSGIIFKGSGFYSTDYKSGSNKTITGSTPPKEDKKESKKEDKAATPDVKTSGTSSDEKVKK
ncbi:MAG: zinc ribbon domain-containing protein [Actinobacteria bacterium]|nr:zinc ribbon domain-containing protein [Actinomycetota bacterium]MCL5070888.1 zinc ribbon domain-containing protein [Actinomycetota bacterium]